MNTNWKEWLKAALVRAVRTFAEAAIAYIGTGAVVLGDVNWLGVLSAGAFGFVTAILMALSGLPEVGNGAGKPVEEKPPARYAEDEEDEKEHG